MILTATQSGFWHWWTAERVSAFGQVLGAIGTVGAFIFTGFLLTKQLDQFKDEAEARKAEAKERAEREADRKAERLAQRRVHAERVSAWLFDDPIIYDGETFECEVHGRITNAGSTAIKDIDIYVLDKGEPADWALRPVAPASRYAILAGGDYHEDYFTRIVKPKIENPCVEIHFTDVNEVRWRIDRNRTLSEIVPRDVADLSEFVAK